MLAVHLICYVIRLTL